MFVITAISGRERPDRAIGLVALDHEPARADSRVASELRHDAADDPGRVAAGLREHEGDHRRRRRLAVGSADHDRGLRRHELREERRPRNALDPMHMCGRDDRLPPRRRRRLAPQVDLDPLERAHEDRVAGRPTPAPRRRGRGRRSRRRTCRSRRSRRSRAAAPPERALSAGQVRSPPRRSCPPHRREPSRASRCASPRAAPGRRAMLRRARARVSISAFGHDDRSSASLEVTGIERLVVGGRVRIRDEDRRSPGGGELPDRPSSARDGEVGRREDVCRSGRSAPSGRSRRGATRGAKSGVVALARDVQHGRAVVAPGRDRHLVERRRTGERSEDGHRRRVAGRGRIAGAASSRLAPRWASGIGRPTTSALPPERPGMS